ncbi:MAG TPA: serpin family protein [Solirubrobacteraceae bacterium]|nr:serpin family protein [Solirubrobacteraceae bacterium]
MRVRGLLPIGMFLLVAGCGSAGPVTSRLVRADVPRATASVAPADAAALRDGNAVFAGRLLAELARGRENVALSPASISEALSMAFAGARGATASEMATALDFNLPPADLGAAFNAVDRSLEGVNGPDVTLNVANALYGQTGQRFNQEFLRVLARDYGAGLRTADFEGAAEAARAEINAWVSEQTAGKIPDLLAAGDVDPSTRLMLVNAVYLKARWLVPFSKESTLPAAFHAPGGAVEVPTMHETGAFGYLQGDGYQALELPYRGGRLAFDILLPSSGGLQSLLSRLAGGGPLSLLDGMRRQQVGVALPKFRLDTRFELAAPLRALGMRLAFEPGSADLSGIAGRPGDLYVGTVVHEAYLSVDEEGTEAAAATAVGIRASAMPAPPPIQFVVDRPFVFVLRDLKTGAVLFTGVVSRP